MEYSYPYTSNYKMLNSSIMIKNSETELPLIL